MFLARAKSIVRRLNNDGLIHLYSQLGICQVAAKCFPHLQHIEFDPTGIPVWSFYNLHAPSTFIGLRGKHIFFIWFYLNLHLTFGLLAYLTFWWQEVFFFACQIQWSSTMTSFGLKDVCMDAPLNVRTLLKFAFSLC